MCTGTESLEDYNKLLLTASAQQTKLSEICLPTVQNESWEHQENTVCAGNESLEDCNKLLLTVSAQQTKLSEICLPTVQSESCKYKENTVYTGNESLEDCNKLLLTTCAQVQLSETCLTIQSKPGEQFQDFTPTADEIVGKKAGAQLNELDYHQTSVHNENQAQHSNQTTNIPTTLLAITTIEKESCAQDISDST